jgi:hypothetical protein
MKQEFKWKNILKNNKMGLIKEPEGVDFIIESTPPTEIEKNEISDFINKRKAERNKVLNKESQRR